MYAAALGHPHSKSASLIRQPPHMAGTPLHSAAAAGNVAGCKRLLRAGCKADALSNGRRSALHVACLKCLADVAEAGHDRHGRDI